MKKKLLSLLLLASMVATLTACGSEDVRGEVSEPAAVEESAETEVVEETAAPEATEEVAEEVSDEEFSLGSSKDSVYTNEFFGIGCALDDDWTFATDDQIEAQNQQVADALGGNYAQAIENGITLTDMIAVNANQTDTMQVTLEKLTGINRALTEEKYVEISVPQLTPSLESIGVTVESIETGTINFAGGEHACIRLHGTTQDVDLYETIAVMKKSDYIYLVAASSFFENSSEEYLGNFYSLN